jgi:hypothetical protein
VKFALWFNRLLSYQLAIVLGTKSEEEVLGLGSLVFASSLLLPASDSRRRSIVPTTRCARARRFISIIYHTNIAKYTTIISPNDIFDSDY